MKARTRSEWRAQVLGARSKDDIWKLIEQFATVSTAHKLELHGTLCEVVDDSMAEGLTEAQAVEKLAKSFLVTNPWRGVWDGQHR